jgi:simple sugar transport system permease protein
MDVIVTILAAAVRSGTPILYATLGEILTEKSGVMNLGLEGLLLVGALTGFWTAFVTGNPYLAIAVAFLAGVALSAVHAFLCVSLGANQVVSGLALTMFGTGVSSLLGRGMVGETIKGLGVVQLPLLSQIPIFGKVLFSHDILVYLSYILIALIAWFLQVTRAGLNLRAVGEDPHVVESVGVDPVRLRYIYTLIGGGLAAVGGAYLSVVYTKMWGDQMSAGRGWIAVALVIFAVWHPLRAAFGAYLFGGVTALQLRIQAAGTSIPAPLLLMLPYLFTIFVLFVISVRKGKGIILGAPAALGVPYQREERT